MSGGVVEDKAVAVTSIPLGREGALCRVSMRVEIVEHDVHAPFCHFPVWRKTLSPKDALPRYDRRTLSSRSTSPSGPATSRLRVM